MSDDWHIELGESNHGGSGERSLKKKEPGGCAGNIQEEEEFERRGQKRQTTHARVVGKEAL